MRFRTRTGGGHRARGIRGGAPARAILAALLAGALLPLPGPGRADTRQAADAVAPEAAGPGVPASGDAGGVTGFGTPGILAAEAAKAAGRPVEAADWMIVAAHPAAVEAGAGVLAAGGSAADAMVAAQAVLGLVEPQSSGLGGGAFLVWYDAGTGRITTLDGRETAPAAARPTLFLDADGAPLSFFDAVVGGRSVGVPGTPALMEHAHRLWGRLAWRPLFDPAIRLAEEGFPVSPRLAALVAADRARLGRYPDTAAYFLPGGTPVAEGDLLRNPAYADTLGRLAGGGAASFYAGPVAEAIVAAVTGAADNPGLLDMADLAAYRAIERPAVCLPYRGHEVCGMGPPSSGGLTVGQILGLLSGSDLAALGPDAPESWRLIGDASRLAFADRGRYMADSDFVPVPVKGLLDPAYLAERRKLLAGGRALGTVEAGVPPFDHALNHADGGAIEFPSTSHISIVDAAGNALSMTTTIENGFGSRLMAAGMLLNNELTDFSFRTQVDGVPVANRVEPRKRPRSSMAPTIVLRDGAPVLVLGSPGGSRIIGYVAQALIAVLDWDLDVQQAVSLAHRVNRFGTYELEEAPGSAALAEALAGMGYEVSLGAMTSGLHAIAIGTGGLRGGADPRREGIALGGDAPPR